MRVYVTGVAGFLGSHLADAMLEAGHDVAGCDSLIGGDLKNVSRDVRTALIDCNELDRLRRHMAGAEVIYHCAATAYEGLSVFSPAIVTRNIVGATASAMSAACAVGARRFVYCSSMARYGANAVPFTEDMEPRPQDPYGIGKVAGEQLVRNLAGVHGLEHVIAVPHNIIGPRQKYDDPYRNVASIMINRMLQGKQPVIYGDGEQRRCFSFVQDDVPVLAAMATAPVDGEVVNVGPDEEFVTINQLAALIAELVGFHNLDPVYVPDRPQEVRLANCSADKARRLFGYQTKFTLRRGLEEMVESVRASGPRPFVYHLPVEIVSEKTPRTWAERRI